MSKDEAMKAMARRICADLDPNKAYQYLDGSRDDYPTMRSALAAIMETQRLDAELANALLRVGLPSDIAERIRTGDHYALAGER